jgi:hypothetical protein
MQAARANLFDRFGTRFLIEIGQERRRIQDDSLTGGLGPARGDQFFREAAIS